MPKDFRPERVRKRAAVRTEIATAGASPDSGEHRVSQPVLRAGAPCFEQAPGGTCFLKCLPAMGKQLTPDLRESLCGLKPTSHTHRATPCVVLLGESVPARCACVFV